MDNQSWDKWPKAKIEEWTKFWTSEMGQEALARIKAIKQMQLDLAMTQGDPNLAAAYVGRAAGAEMILADIESGINAYESLKRKEGKAK